MKIGLGAADLSENELRAFRVGRRYVLVAKVGGRYRAMDNTCNHGGCLLSGGWLAQNMVVCPCHEVGFDLDTGKNLTSPGICGDQQVFQVSEEEGKLVLEGLAADH